MSVAPGELEPRVSMASLDVLGRLARFARERTPPEAALAEIRALGSAHDLEVDLVWERDGFSGGLHYDALLFTPGLGTLSLSLSPEDATPWPLRGALSSREQDVLRVNGEHLSFERAVAGIDFLWDDVDLVRHLVDLCLVAEAVRRRQLEPSAQAREQAMNAFLARRGLVDRAAVGAWLAERGLDARQLDALVAQEACRAMLRDDIASPERLDRLWDREPGAFDVVQVVRLHLHDRALASELAVLITSGRLGFYEVLEQQFLAGATVVARRGTLASLPRRSLSPELSATLFSAPPGAVVAHDRDLLRVLKVETTDRRHPSTVERLKDCVFEEWLASQRAKATIEWFWGTVAQTDAALRTGKEQSP